MKYNPAPLSELIRNRSYARRRTKTNHLETWDETVDRCLYSPTMGLVKLGKFTTDETELVDRMLRQRKAFGSARWLWVGGTRWVEHPDNYGGAFNCSAWKITDWASFGLMMDLAMQGCGTGASVELSCLKQLPPINTHLNINLIGQPGDFETSKRREETIIWSYDHYAWILVGDSRKGWVDAYQALLELSSSGMSKLDVYVDIRGVRPAGERLKGFGGVANPIALPTMFTRCAEILNSALGRQLNSLEVCLLIGEAANAVVAGNIRRSAGMRIGSSSDGIFTTSKDNLWQQDETGKWVIDERRDALRSANHTRAFHQKPTYEECLEAVRKQFYSGEGAIQWSGEAVARSNADLLKTVEQKKHFLALYPNKSAREYLQSLDPEMTKEELDHRMGRYLANPCHEIIGNDFMCNLAEVHLNQLNPFDLQEQADAFRASALQAAALLQREFNHPRIDYSRKIDPIVGVSATGFFTFFTNLLGVDYVKWWAAGRTESWDSLSDEGDSRLVRASKLVGLNHDLAGRLYKKIEAEFCKKWRSTVEATVYDYCNRHKLRCPNRCTTVKPSGSMSLLTGTDCNGLHPPFAAYFIRRMTFGKNDPVALAAIDYGYSVVPSQSNKDENGKLLDDPFDERCTEWLVEVPVKNQIVHNFPELESIKFREFSALAHFDFYMVIQQNYVTHTGSVTLSLSEDEIEPLAKCIYEAIQNDEGYVGAALLAKSDAPFPRLPFEEISKEQYDALIRDVLQRRKSENFGSLLTKYLETSTETGPQDNACEGLICELK